METNAQQYDFNLFKPVSPYGKKNRNLIITLLIIWFVAIFGFQFMLILLQKPTPEQSLLVFEQAREKYLSGDSSVEVLKGLINPMISVAGKSSVKAADREVLNQAITHYVYRVVGNSQRDKLKEYVKELSVTRDKLVNAKDAEYAGLQEKLAELKMHINEIANETTGVDPTQNKPAILPYALDPGYSWPASVDDAALVKVMQKYLIHNQSVLTDTKIMGFPLHYFYTAEFLLILFVLLSLFYSIRITQLQKKFSIIEK